MMMAIRIIATVLDTIIVLVSLLAMRNRDKIDSLGQDILFFIAATMLINILVLWNG